MEADLSSIVSADVKQQTPTYSEGAYSEPNTATFYPLILASVHKGYPKEPHTIVANRM